MNNFCEKANFIWSNEELIRGTFKRSKYQMLRPLEVIESDIRTLEKKIMGLDREMAG